MAPLIAAPAPTARPPAQASVALARKLHDTVVQRLFGLSMLLGASGPLDPVERELCSAEVNAAMSELRAALLDAATPHAESDEQDALAELGALHAAFPGLQVSTGPDTFAAPQDPGLASLYFATLAEAFRNIRKHASPTQVTVSRDGSAESTTLTVINDGCRGHRSSPPGVGVRLIKAEAALRGGSFDAGMCRGGKWEQRLTIPLAL